ncbi:MAG TPA: glycoside hydrolase family 38 C-terminal domain-containing protein, partial [Nitrospiria bacterium]|nr:glycoside hydrolase family 38 C-terminal domain-containing protein [Nitrospiria bacterium]
MAHQEAALIQARALLSNAMHWIADRVASPDPQGLKLVIFNPLSWRRTGPALVEIPMSPQQEPLITAPDGTIVPSQRVQQTSGGTIRYVVAPSNIPSVGYASFKVALMPRKSEETNSEEFANKVYENAFYRLEFAPGGLKSIYDKTLNRELLKTGEFLGGEIFALDSIGCDSSSYTGFGEVAQPSWKTIEKASQYSPHWRLLESGSVRTGWRMEQPFKEATVRLDMYAYQQTKRLEFNISLLHWSGAIYKEYRMAMPVNIPDGQVSYDAPYAAFEVGKDELQDPAFEGWYSVPSTQIHPRFVQDWISATNGDFGVMLSSQATSWDYLDSKEKKDLFTLLQPILLASRRSCHPQGNFYSPAGDYDFHFALTSFKG